MDFFDSFPAMERQDLRDFKKGIDSGVDGLICVKATSELSSPPQANSPSVRTNNIDVIVILINIPQNTIYKFIFFILIFL